MGPAFGLRSYMSINKSYDDYDRFQGDSLISSTRVLKVLYGGIYRIFKDMNQNEDLELTLSPFHFGRVRHVPNIRFSLPLHRNTGSAVEWPGTRSSPLVVR